MIYYIKYCEPGAVGEPSRQLGSTGVQLLRSKTTRPLFLPSELPKTAVLDVFAGAQTY